MNKRQPRRRGWAVPVLSALAALTITGPVAAHDAEGSMRNHPSGHVKKPVEGWPPQPQGATNVRNLSDGSFADRRRMDRDTRFSRLEERFKRDPRLRQLAGRKMTPLFIVEDEDKADERRGRHTRYQFFDRAANATVTVVETAGGESRVESTPAATYQPEITEAEAAEAIALAKRYFVQHRMPRAAQLQGFGIQAYRPEGNGFYDGRVVYVSLHVNSDTDPEYVAWVDLTRQQVFQARKETHQ